MVDVDKIKKTTDLLALVGRDVKLIKMAITADLDVAAWSIRPRTAGTTCPAWESPLQVDLELEAADFEPDPAFLTLAAGDDDEP